MTKVMTLAMVIGLFQAATSSAEPCGGNSSISGISKYHGAAGEPVRITGENLSGGRVWIQFDNERVAPKVIADNQVQFRVPDFRPGRYTVSVWVDGRRASGSFTFRIEG